MQKIFEFLFSLNRVSWTSSTRFGWAVDWRAWILPIVIALVCLGYWSYRKQSVASGRRVWLWVVRGLLLATVFVLFARPQLVLEREERTRSVVAVWVDASSSMTLEDPYRDAGMQAYSVDMTKRIGGVPQNQARLNRYQLALGAVEDAKWLKSLSQTQDVMFFSGSSHAQHVGTAKAPEQVKACVDRLKNEKPTGESTDVPTVVREILQSVQGTRVSAVVLLTDGQTTEPGSRPDQALSLAQRSSAKIFALPLGQKAEPFNLKLANMQVPPRTFVKDPVLVKMLLSGSGIDTPTPVKVTLFRKEGGTLTPLVSKEFTIDPAKKDMDIELIFRPEKKDVETDRYDLVGKVEPTNNMPTDELTLADNQIPGRTDVVDAQINAILIDTYPRWEFRYLKNELIREKTVNVSTLQLSADADFAQEGDPRLLDKNGVEKFPGPIQRFPENKEEMKKYDILIIGDVEASYFTPEQQKLILDFVKNQGGGILWIAGSNFNPETYKGTPMEPLLPITPEEVDLRSRSKPVENVGFNLVLTTAGKESNLFRFHDDVEANKRQLGELPEIYTYKPVVGLRPGAEVLAVHPTDKQGGVPAPLIVLNRYGRGRTIFSAICDTWRWRRYTGEPLYQNYWLQMCRTLYEGKAIGEDRILELAAESTRVEIGTPIKLKMTVHDSSLLPQIPTKVPVAVKDAAGRPMSTILLQRSSNTEGEDRFEGMTTATQVGTMTLEVEPGALPSATERIEVTVDYPQREQQNTTADFESLEMMAGRSTLPDNSTVSNVMPPYKAEELVKYIPDRSLPTLNTQSEELWYKPIALVLVVALATIEWLLRKRAGLI